MSYIIKQIYQDAQSISQHNEQSLKYMTPILEGEVMHEQRTISTRTFMDCGVMIPSGMQAGVNYYFHARVKKTAEEQKFDIFLTNRTKLSDLQSDDNIQYIEKIRVNAGVENEWFDYTVIFTPAMNFNSIVFKMDRTNVDMRSSRDAIIIFEELNIVHNFLPSKVQAVKIGVQSTPGLLTCINGQPIRIGRSGIYELRNPALKVVKFGVAVEGERQVLLDDDFQQCECLFGVSRVKHYPMFTLDYMYERED